MGWLGCLAMSELLIRHLQKQGPISIEAAANRYWRRHERGYCRDDDSHKQDALMALEQSALFYAESGLIEPTNRRGAYVIDWLLDYSNITEEEVNFHIHTASAMEFNNLITMAFQWDTDGYWIWFDPIVWKLTEHAMTHPELLQPYEGVDL